jgi:hypothetical protein
MQLNITLGGACCAVIVTMSCLTLAACGDSETPSEEGDTLTSSTPQPEADAGSSTGEGAGEIGSLEIPGTYDFGSGGCARGAPTHACICGEPEADCVAEEGNLYPRWAYCPSCTSVKYTGQTMRQVLILNLKSFIGGLTAAIDAGVYSFATADEVLDALDFYFRFNADEDGETEISASLLLTKGSNPSTELKEMMYGDISTSNLSGKLAGNDAKTDHRCWDPNNAKAEDNPNCDGITQGEFAGWPGITTPDEMLAAWFLMLADNAVSRSNGELDWDVHLTAEGHDLAQLIQKFLTVAITFSQGVDDYLDHDMEGKGLKSSNERVEGQAYTDLAHAWDEGFGYFGAARDYDAYTDEEIAGKGGADDRLGYHDTDADGTISLKSEYNFGASQNAAKRDHGATVSTDFTQEIFDAFLAGRTLIHNSPGTLSEAHMTELMGHRDAIVWGWEKAYAATVIHYINDTLADMVKVGVVCEEGDGACSEYSRADHAKHWGELKGFALGFQFSPRSPLSDAAFAEFHGLVGTAPVLDGGDLAAYETDLLVARAILEVSYGFASENVSGW